MKLLEEEFAITANNDKDGDSADDDGRSGDDDLQGKKCGKCALAVASRRVLCNNSVFHSNCFMSAFRIGMLHY